VTLSDRPAARPPRRYALVVWATAVAAYVVAVLNRSSFGVAGLEAADRFGTSASTLATFVVVQLVVYATLQVPVGLLLDRFGPRRLIATGALLMSAGQLAIALSTTTELALAARVLIGAGDALTFVSVIRLLPAWFSLKRVPLVTQLTGIVGMLGQVAAAVPLVLVLHGGGWTAAFVGASALGVLAAVAVLLLVRDVPDPSGHAWWRRHPAPPSEDDDVPLAALVGAGHAPRPVPRRPSVLRPTLREPGTWLGFWVHFIGAYSTHVVVLLWGFPFLVSGQGRTPAEVSGLLTVNVVAAIVAGPVVGHVSGHRPERRLLLVAVVTGAIGLAWVGVLLPAEPLPLWALAVFMAVIAIGGPTALIGLDIARSHNPRERMGTAVGFANAGGFVGALATMLGVGLVLDARGPAGAGVTYPLADYRVALAFAGVTWLVGVVGLAVAARRVEGPA
jgi:sugar phosphate permease